MNRPAAIAAVVGGVVSSVAALSWWFTEPLEPLDDRRPAPAPRLRAESALPPNPDSAAPAPNGSAPAASADPGPASTPGPALAEHWTSLALPLSGDDAKIRLLAFLRALEADFAAHHGYTAVFVKRERVNDKLSPLQRMEMKLLHEPFSVYLKNLEPEAGREVIYAKGRYDDHMIAHAGGLARILVPRLKVDPAGPLALANSRHPITNVGVLNLVRKLVHHRELDLGDHESKTVLDTVLHDDGRLHYRSRHWHPRKSADRLFAYTEVRYDPERLHPVRFEGRDWPESGLMEHEDQCPLLEHYEYRDLRLNPPLEPIDFDPANPAYEFHRF